MSNQAFLTERAIQIIVDNKILEATQAGEFDNLPGLGKPCELIDAPYDPHWWIRNEMKREQIDPKCVG